METNVTELINSLKDKPYFSISLDQAELLFDEYSKGNTDALQVLKTGLVPLALRFTEMQTDTELYKLTRAEKYAAALDLLDKLILPYLSSDRKGFNKYFATRINAYLLTALKTKQFSSYNNNFNVTLNSKSVNAKQEAINWLKSDLLQTGTPSLAVIEILNSSVVPNLQPNAKNILKNILQFVNLPQVWSYVCGVAPEDFTAAMELTQDQALRILNSQTNYQTEIAKIKRVNQKSVATKLNKTIDARTIKSLEGRKQKYSTALKDVDIDAIKKGLADSKLIYILDEYMLCKNNLSAKQITLELGLHLGSLNHYSDNILKYINEGSFKKGKPYRTAVRTKDEHLKLFNTLVENPEQFRATLTDPDQLYVLDNYFLADTSIKQILEHLNVYKNTLNKIIEDILVNAGAKPTKQKREPKQKPQKVNVRLTTRIQKYADLLKNINVEAFKIALANPKYAYIVDEYMINANNLSVAEVMKNLEYSVINFQSAVNCIELRMAKINKVFNSTTDSPQSEALKNLELTTLEVAAIYSNLFIKQPRVRKIKEKPLKSVSSRTITEKDINVTEAHKQSIWLTKRLIKGLPEEAIQGFLQNDDTNVAILFTKGYISNPALTCKQLCQEMNVSYSQLYDIQKRLNVQLKLFIPHWQAIGRFYNEQNKQQFMEQYGSRLSPTVSEILQKGIFKNLGASGQQLAAICNMPQSTVSTIKCALLRFMNGDESAQKRVLTSRNPKGKPKATKRNLRAEFLQLTEGMDYKIDIEPLLSLAARVVYNEYIMAESKPDAKTFAKKVGEGTAPISTWIRQIKSNLQRGKYLLQLQDQNTLPPHIKNDPKKQKEHFKEMSRAINYRKLRIYAKIGGEENIQYLLASVTPSTQEFWEKYLLAKNFKQRLNYIQSRDIKVKRTFKMLNIAKEDLNLFAEKQKYIQNIETLYGNSEQILNKAKPYFDKLCYDVLSQYMLDPTCISIDAARQKLLCLSRTITQLEEKILGWLTMYMDSPAPEKLSASYKYTKSDTTIAAANDGSAEAFNLNIASASKSQTKKQTKDKNTLSEPEDEINRPTKITLPQAIKLMERVQKNLQKLGLQQTVEYQIQKAGLIPIYQSIMPDALKVSMQNIISDRGLVLSGKQQPLVNTLDNFVTTQMNKKQILEQIEQSFSMQDITDTLKRTPRLYQYFNQVLMSDDIFAREQFRENMRINNNTLLDIEDQIINLVDDLCDRRLDILCFIDDWAVADIQGNQYSGSDFLLNVVAPAVLTEAERKFMIKFMMDYHYTDDEKRKADKDGKIESAIQIKLYTFKKRKAEVDELITWAGGYQHIKEELEPKLDDTYKDILWNDVLSYVEPTKAERLKKYGSQNTAKIKKAIDYLLNELSILSISAYNSGRIFKNHDNDRRLILNDYDDDYIAKKNKLD